MGVRVAAPLHVRAHLVQNQVTDILHREAAGVLQMVHQPAWRADNQVRPLGQQDGLRDHVHPTDDHRDLDADHRAERLKLLADLDGQLACRRHDQAKERLRVLQQLVEHRQAKGCGLARARLG
eukprot:scaffold36187_cov135-Isochrysis_galbana.AAC.4